MLNVWVLGNGIEEGRGGKSPLCDSSIVCIACMAYIMALLTHFGYKQRYRVDISGQQNDFHTK